jgi:hypothetical protein
MRAICTVIAAASAIALAAPVGPAFAAGFTLNLSASSTPIVGKPMVVQATGTIPAGNLAYPYWFSLSAIPPSVTSTCPSDHFVAKQLANSTGGTIVVFTQREATDAAGNFSIPIGITPSAAGSVLLCGYTDDGATNTLAGASLVLNIQPASPAGRRATIPEEARAGVRSCRALLARPGSCIRRVVRQANARCGRLPIQGRRTTCLRAVRRVAGRR